MSGRILYIFVLCGFMGCTPSVEKESLLFEKQNWQTIVTFEKALGQPDTTFYLEKIKDPLGRILNYHGLVWSVREREGSLPLKTIYFLDQDSITNYIIYEWNKNIGVTDLHQLDSLNANNTDFNDEYVAVFNQLVAEYTSLYGEPFYADKKLKQEKFIQGQVRHFSYYKWQHGDQYIELSLRLIPGHLYKIFTKVCWGYESSITASS